MVENECHLSSHVDILRGSDNLTAILKTPPRRLSSYVYALFTHRNFVHQCMNTLIQEGDTYQEHMYTLVPQVKIGLFMDDKNSNSIILLIVSKRSQPTRRMHIAVLILHLRHRANTNALRTHRPYQCTPQRCSCKTTREKVQVR